MKLTIVDDFDKTVEIDVEGEETIENVKAIIEAEVWNKLSFQFYITKQKLGIPMN